LKRLFVGYVKAKQAQAVLDYDDLLLYWSRMMQLDELASLVSSRFDHVLVDKYQDTNALQAAILLGLKPNDCRTASIRRRCRCQCRRGDAGLVLNVIEDETQAVTETTREGCLWRHSGDLRPNSTR
jgi:superfamily I DNA/RNA helicase